MAASRWRRRSSRGPAPVSSTISWSCAAGRWRSPTRDLVKGLAPLAAKTDRIDAWVLVELSRRDLVPAIWLPDPAVRAERERARWRLHLVRHRTAVKNRVHSALVAVGPRCPVSDLFGTAGRQLLEGLA